MAFHYVFCTYKCATEMESAGSQVSELLVACIVLHNWRETNIKYCIGYGNNVFIYGVLKKCTAGGTICIRSKEINNCMYLSKSAFFNIWVAIMFWMGHKTMIACWFYNVFLYVYLIESLKCHSPYPIYLFIFVVHLFLYLTPGVARKATGLIWVVEKHRHIPVYWIFSFVFFLVKTWPLGSQLSFHHQRKIK